MIQPQAHKSLAYRIATVVAGGMLAAAGFLATTNFVYAITATNVQPASLVAGTSNTVTVSLTTGVNIPNNGKIKIAFPSGYDVSTVTGPVVCSGIDGTVNLGVAGQLVTLTRTGGTTAVQPAVISCALLTIRNPQISGPTGSYAITTTDSVDAVLETDNAVASDSMTPGALSVTNVQPTSVRISTTNAVTITFTTANPIANNGQVRVTFPAGFNVASASNGTCSTMDGTFDAVVIAGQAVSIVRTAASGTSEPAGAQTCTISGIRNPTTAGSAGTYQIHTLNVGGLAYDQDIAVTADSMIATSDAVPTTPVELTYNVEVSTPAAADVYMPGDDIAVTWATGGTGVTSAVNLSYSTDGSLTWTSIVSGTTNDSAYTWTAPNISAQNVTIRVQGTDLVTVLSTDDSDAFSIGTGDDEAVDTGVPGEDPATEDEDESNNLLPEGTFIKGASWSTVYYIDANGNRRPFLDSQTFYTYANSFDSVIDVEDSYLSNFTIGAPMLPMAGTVLVKIQSVDKVYALGEDGELHWITSESVATSLYGSSWADYVIDVPVTAWSHFMVGSDISSTGDWTADASLLQTRAELNSK